MVDISVVHGIVFINVHITGGHHVSPGRLGLFHEFLQLFTAGGQYHLVAQQPVAIRGQQLHVAEELRAPQSVQAFLLEL